MAFSFTNFIYCHGNSDCLSSTEFLILSIWPWIYSSCSFWHIFIDVLLWTPSHDRLKAGWQALTYIQQLCEDMGCSPEDLPEAMNDREEWRERVRDIHAGSTTWWWWWWAFYPLQTQYHIPISMEPRPEYRFIYLKTTLASFKISDHPANNSICS